MRWLCPPTHVDHPLVTHPRNLVAGSGLQRLAPSQALTWEGARFLHTVRVNLGRVRGGGDGLGVSGDVNNRRWWTYRQGW